ncbi:MAG: replication protein [Cytophagaceae bacterium]|nr:MAG: replication protein [Cytophagaceae bacterium]
MTQHADDQGGPDEIPDTQATHTRRGVVLYEESPFLPSVKTRTKRITNNRNNMMLVNSNTGEIQSPIAGFWESKEVDSTSFVKLFIAGVRALAELTNAGTRVFELLYLEMQKNIGRDEAYLSFTGLPKGMTMGRSTFARGLSELIDKKFIAPQPKVGWYWVNPDFIFNGDRLSFVKEFRRVKSVEKSPADNLMQDLFSEGVEKSISD